MTRVLTPWLLAPLTFCLACGDSGETSATTGLSATSITGASATTGASEGAPTSSNGGTADPGETTQGSNSGGAASQSGSDATSDEPTTVSAGETTSETTAGPATMTGAQTTGAIDDPVPCQIKTTQLNPIPPDVLLVLDKSGSMALTKWDHDKDVQTPLVTRWFSLYYVVKAVLTEFDKSVNFGVKLYPYFFAGPYVEEGACTVKPGVEVETALMNTKTILASIPDALANVQGGTPMETGLKEAYAYLQSLGPDKQRFALMVADGEISKTCEGEVFKEALGLVKQAHANGIYTYVVGIDVDPDVEFDLENIAEAGGKPNPNSPSGIYGTTNQPELLAAIQQIVDDTLSCTIDVDPEPSQPELFQVWIGEDQVAAATDCGKDDGWVWTKPHVQIELCGQACLDLKKAHQVDVRYFCEAN